MFDLDGPHQRVVHDVWWQRLTAVTRILLAVGVLPPGAIKIFGHPFTRIGAACGAAAFFPTVHEYVYDAVVCGALAASATSSWPRATSAAYANRHWASRRHLSPGSGSECLSPGTSAASVELAGQQPPAVLMRR
jgi:hypothetical protein